MVPRARGSMDMVVGYNGHVYRHVVGNSRVTQPIFNSEMKNKKVIDYLNAEFFILGVARLKIYILSLKTGHHGH